MKRDLTMSVIQNETERKEKKMKTPHGTILAFAGLAIVATWTVRVFGAECNFVWRDGVGTSVTTAAEWFDAENWQGGNVAQTAADWALLTSKAGRLFVHADRALALGKLNAYRGGLTNNSMTTNDSYQVYFISDHGVSIPNKPSDNKSMISQVRLYADLSVSSASGAYCDTLLMCGDMDNAAPAVFNTGFTHHLDLYANTSDEVRVNPGSTNYFKQSYGPPTWYAPQGSSVAVVGQWSQTAGSRYLFRTGAAHVLCAGTLVHGDGIPQGAFLKRIFNDGTIEISESATQTIASNSVTFDPFSPKVRQFIMTYAADAGNSSGETSYACKHRAEDEFTMEIGEMTLSAAKNRCFDTKVGCYPARWLLHDATGVQGKICLRTCNLEFAAKMDGDASAVGLPNTYVIQEQSSSKSRLTVADGLSGSIQCISNLVGTVVKNGGGALRTSLARNAALNTGVLVVENGVVELAGAAEHYVKTLAISNGAAIRISDGGLLRVDVLNVAPGARVEGGAIQVSSLSDCLAARAAGLVCADGGCLSCPGTTDAVLWEPATTNVAGNPALWFDLSREETFTAATAAFDGNERVTRLNDVRGAGYMFATNTTSVQGPRIVRDSGGRPRFYYAEYIGGAANDSLDKQHALVWNTRLANIRSVFKVLSKPVNVAGGQFLGSTWDGVTGWLRPGGVPWNYALFFDGTVKNYPAVSNGEFRVNGFMRDWHDGLAYPGGKTDTTRAECDYVPQLVELHLAEGISPEADNCGDFTKGGNLATPRAGGTMLYEILIYTNNLTTAEKLQIRGYLMRKWLDAEAEYAMDAGHPANGGTVDVGANGWNFSVSSGNVRLAAVTGSGPVEKRGAGTLYVEDHARPAASLKVSAGRIVLRSETPSADGLPEGAYLHVDASDPTTYSLDGSGKVATWNDRRGGGYPTMAKIGSGSAVPKGNKLNGLTMISCQPYEAATDAASSGFTFTECENAHSVFSVLFTQTNSATFTERFNGGVLLGNHAGQQPVVDGMLHGIWRFSGGTRTGTIVDSYDKVYSGIESTLCYYGVGATRGRLDGVERNFTDTYYKCDGTGDMVSLVTYERVWTDALAQGWNKNGGTAYWGGQIIGETIIYQTALAPSSVDKVEAYLNKKWFNRDTVGHRPALAASLEVASGAELELVGGAPITVSSLSGGGTVRGGVTLASGAELAVAIVDGEIVPLTLTGALEGAGTVRVIGDPNTLALGRHTVLTAASVSVDAWTLVFDTPAVRRCCVLRRTATTLLLEVMPRGFRVIFR